MGRLAVVSELCPRVVDHTEPVHQLHFEEAAELAYFGAKILHPTCVQPAKYAGIPVRLLNTMQPDAEGTTISNRTEYGKIKAVAAKDNIIAIKIKSSRMLLATGFLRKVFEIFESYQTPIDMVCTSEVGASKQQATQASSVASKRAALQASKRHCEQASNVVSKQASGAAS